MSGFFGKHNNIIRIIQHVLAAFIAFAVAMIFTGSSMIISGPKGDYSYNLYESDKNRNFEDSYLFNNILGNNISDLARLLAIRTQLENKGEYDGEKSVDVTAYVNRYSTLSGDYITAVYKLSDLIKWAEGGFTYENRNFTKENL